IYPFLAGTLLAWSDVYEGVHLEDVFRPSDADEVRLAREEWCTADFVPSRPLREIFDQTPDNTRAWRRLVELNTPSAGRLGIPVLMTHGDPDPLVPVSGVVDLHTRLCDAKEDV